MQVVGLQTADSAPSWLNWIKSFDWIYRRGLHSLIISLGKSVNYTENLLFSAASKSLRAMMAFIHLRFASFNKNAQTSTVGNALVWVLALLLSLLVLAYSM